jgi:hypothetical protein
VLTTSVRWPRDGKPVAVEFAEPGEYLIKYTEIES